MKNLLFTVSVAALFLATGTAHAQREGGAFFGPFSHGDSSGASTNLQQQTARPINNHRRQGAPTQQKQIIKHSAGANDADEKATPNQCRCTVPGNREAHAWNLTDKMPNDSYVQCGELWTYKLPNGEIRSNMGEKSPLPAMIKNGELFIDDKLCVFRTFSCTTQPLKQC